jgi:hypothetical protein
MAFMAPSSIDSAYIRGKHARAKENTIIYAKTGICDGFTGDKLEKLLDKLCILPPKGTESAKLKSN